jgi:hypothetical protein
VYEQYEHARTKKIIFSFFGLYRESPHHTGNYGKYVINSFPEEKEILSRSQLTAE